MGDSSNFSRIGLYGPFGWGNLGDAAIQEAMMYNVRRRQPHVEFRGISLRPDNTEEIHGIKSFPIARTWSFPSNAVGSPVQTENTAAPAHKVSGTGSKVGRTWKTRLKAIPILGPVLWKVTRPLQELLRELRFIGRTITFLRSLDLLILSGGGQLSDDWGGPWEHPYSILKWTVCARLAGCRVYAVSLGAGPFRQSPSQLLLRTAMRLAHYRSYRDWRSHDLLAPWGFTRRDPIYPDLAFSLPPSPSLLRDPVPALGSRSKPDSAPSSSGTPSVAAERPLVLGISPMSYCFPRKGAWPNLDAQRYKRYRRTMHELTTQVLAQGQSVVLLCSEIGNDCHAFDDLVQDLQNSGNIVDEERIQCVPTRNLSHLLEQIASIDIIVSSRLHGVILSFLQHKPAIALSYDPKTLSVMEHFGQTAYCLGIEEATTEQLQARLQALQGELPMARERIGRVLVETRAQLEDQYDRLFGPPQGASHQEQISVHSMTGSPLT